MNQLIVIFFWLALGANGAFPQVAVIAHKTVPIDKIEKSELLDFYTGDKSFWNDGKPAFIYDLKSKGAIRDAFYNFLGIRSSRIKSIWMKRMLSGDADPPDSLESEEEMLRKVSSTPGAIGFISQAKINDDVKVLVIIGKEKT